MLKDALSRMASVFLPTVLMQASEYQQKGNVLSIRFSEGLVKARVKEGTGQIYDVHMDLKAWPGTPSRCGCQRPHCKHAAASLLALQAKEIHGLLPMASHLVQTFQPEQLPQSKAREQDKSHQIVYLLELDFHREDYRVFVHMALGKALKRGGIGTKVPFNTLTLSRKQYCTPADDAILETLLLNNSQNSYFDRLQVRDSSLLEKILLTRRAFLYRHQAEPLLILGCTLEVKPHWHLALDGKQQLELQTEGRSLKPLFLDRLWYYDVAAQSLGPMESSHSQFQLKSLLTAEPIPMEERSPIFLSLEKLDSDFPFPKRFEDRITHRFMPKPVICFYAIPLPNRFIFTADIWFEYEGLRIEAGLNLASLFVEKEEKLIEIQRNIDFETQKLRECDSLLPRRAATIEEKLQCPEIFNKGQATILVHYHQEEDLLRLHSQVLPILKAKGWKIELKNPIYSETIVADDLEWYSELDDRGHDFFAWQLGILIDGKPVSIVPLVVDLISKLSHEALDSWSDDKILSLQLEDGKRLQVAMLRIKPLVRFLLQYGTKQFTPESGLTLKRYQLMLLKETEAAMANTALRWLGDLRLQKQLRQLLDDKALPTISIPKGLQTTLRDYQVQGLSWLQLLRTAGLGGILADDMGLGKTVQTLAHLLLEKEQSRMKLTTLIIAPTSLMGNWLEEATRFAPDLKVLVYHGAERSEDPFDAYDLVITTYGLIQRDKTRFVEYPFYYLILDEAQFIKNSRTKTRQIIQQIKAEHRLCLSGTPLENHLGELWSLFHFLIPGLLGEEKQFRAFFKMPIERHANRDRQMLLTNRVRPFMLRRTKNQVIQELPPKTEMLRMITLQGEQRDLYEAIRMSMEHKVRSAIAQQGMGKSHIILLDALLKLRQICCDPKLLTGVKWASNGSAKMDVLMDLLDNLMAENRRVLVFSQFTSMLQLIEEVLISRQYKYLKLTGQTQNRHQLVVKFQEGQIPIFLISLKAGGTGLNLTRADTVIHYDPWWNPAVEDQATDRSHRIGQENPVFVYKLITAGTVEEAILKMQNKKRALFDGILSESISGISMITEKDIAQFFMPLTD